MRLSTEARNIIRQTALEIFGPDCTVLLFGSRTDDAARGGDIDLLVTCEQTIPDASRKALKLVARLQIRLGDQPIDILVIDPATALQAVHREALRTGIAI